MTFNEACTALKKEGAMYWNPLKYAYSDGRYDALDGNKSPRHYIGVATIDGYFNNQEVQKEYLRGFYNK